jgi:hypothetical protein
VEQTAEPISVEPDADPYVRERNFTHSATFRFRRPCTRPADPDSHPDEELAR